MTVVLGGSTTCRRESLEPPWSVCEVVVVPYVVGAVVSVTVMHVLLFLLHVCMLQECEGARVTAMLLWGSGGGVVAVSAHMGGTRGWGVLSSTGDVPEMSVARGVGGVCDMCMCLARGRVGVIGGEWVRGLGLGFINLGGTWGKWDICVCVLVAVVGVGGGGGVVLGEWFGPGRVVWYYVCVSWI